MRHGWATVVVAGLVALGVSSADAAKWGRGYIRQLPDSAFAIVETSPSGKAVRHLPHHDVQGNLDVPHLCNAIARLGQVKWQDPANAAVAHRHLREHLVQIGAGACRLARKAAPSSPCSPASQAPC